MGHVLNTSSSLDPNGDLSGSRIAEFVIGTGNQAEVVPNRLPLVRSGNLVAKSHSQAGVIDRATAEARVDSSDGDRFEVDLEWETHQGLYGAGQAVSLPHEDGCYWFLVDGQGDLVIKVFDAGGDFADLEYSIYSRNFINVAVEMTLKDTSTGETRSFGDLPASESESGIC